MDIKKEFNMAYDVMGLRKELESVCIVLKEVLTSSINLYIQDPDLHDRVQMSIETIEYQLSQSNQKPKNH